MKRIKYLVLAAVFSALLAVSALHVQAAATPNLIANPSVESVSAGQPANWQTDHWGDSQAAFTYKSEGHTGGKSLYAAITSSGSGDAKWLMQAVAVQPNTTYTYSDYYKSNTDTEIDLAYHDGTGSTTDYEYASTVPASANWQQSDVSFTTPANVGSVSILHLVYQQGWLQTDDFSLTGPAGASQNKGVVSASPAAYTPQIPVGGNNATYAFAQSGDTMYAGGSFASLGNASRSNIGAFSASTGKLTSFAPKVNGAVWAIVPLANGQVALGGEFTTVNGIARRGLAVVDGTTGALNAAFNAGLNGNVYDAKLVNGQLIIGGTFSKKLQAVNVSTGADTGYINLNIKGNKVYRFAVNPDGTRLVAIGKFDAVSGQARRQAFMVNLATPAALLSSWYYQPLMKQCSAPGEDAYLRGVAFAPNGSYFVVDGTGHLSNDGDWGSTICDAAARFETSVLAPAKPTWINYTGGDTLHSVAISDGAVYVGGHNRWLDNFDGHDWCGSATCVSRPGIGALDPHTGVALTWNPERTRGVGAKALFVAANGGLWVGSDTAFGGKLGCSNPGGPNGDDCAGQPLETHAGIGYLPPRP